MISLTASCSSNTILLQCLRGYLQHYYDLDARLKAFEQRRFYSLEIELTNRCNRECVYCYNSSTRNSTKPDLSFDFAQHLIREANKAGIRQLSWLGGEPTLLLDLPDILETSHSCGIENVLFTNGSLLSAKLWDRIRPLVGRVMFHLDTINPDVFALMSNVTPTQGKRMLEHTMANFDYVLNSGFDRDRICFYTVLARPVVERLQETLEYALLDKHVGTTALYPMVRTGRASLTPTSWTLSQEELRHAYELRAQIEKRPELMLLGPSEYCMHYQMTMAYIDLQQRLRPYAGIEHPTFSIKQNSLHDLLDKHYHDLSFASLGCVSLEHEQPVLGNPCGRCISRPLCFGTRTSAFNHHGSVSAGDPFCWISS